jgi:hypothetical protein
MELSILSIEEVSQAKKLGKIDYNATDKRYTSSDEAVIEQFGKVFLTTKYEDNAELKKLGARWDGKKKQHYCKKREMETFRKFLVTNNRLYLDVPFVMKAEFQKKYGMKFDGELKKWFVDESKRCEEIEDFLT